MRACVCVYVQCTQVRMCAHEYVHTRVRACVCVCCVRVYNTTIFPKPTARHHDRLATPHHWVFTVSSKLEWSLLAGMGGGVLAAELTFGSGQAHTCTSGEQRALRKSLGPAVLLLDAQEGVVKRLTSWRCGQLVDAPRPQGAEALFWPHGEGGVLPCRGGRWASRPLTRHRANSVDRCKRGVPHAS